MIRRGTVISIGGFTKNFGTGCPGVFGTSPAIVSGGWPGLKIGTKMTCSTVSIQNVAVRAERHCNASRFAVG